MPAYRLYPLSSDGRQGDPVETLVYDDAAAIRSAMRQAFPFGCDVWRETRYLGRVHGPQPGRPQATPGETPPDSQPPAR